MLDPRNDRVLITGAAGLIGTALRQGLRPSWQNLRITDRSPIPDAANNEEAITADITDRAAMERMMHGVDALVHLAGAGGGDLETLYAANVRGLFDVFESARLAGVKRIVYASSNHAFGCYPIDIPVTPALPPRPDTLYGAFKVLGEVMLQTYFDRHGISSVSIRIGTYRPLPIDQRSLATWLSPNDMVQMVEKSLLHPDPGALVVNGYSGNTRLRNPDPKWEFLGYRPKDDAETHIEMLRGMGIDVDGPWEWPEHGGSFARDPERPARA